MIPGLMGGSSVRFGIQPTTFDSRASHTGPVLPAEALLTVAVEATPYASTTCDKGSARGCYCEQISVSQAGSMFCLNDRAWNNKGATRRFGRPYGDHASASKNLVSGRLVRL